MKNKTKKLLSLVIVVALLAGFAQFSVMADDSQNEKIKIAFIGDSITEGAGATDAATKSFVGIITNETADKYQCANFGVSATSALFSAVSPYTDTEAYYQVLSFKPDILHIMLGTNDIKNENWDQGKDNFKDDYKAIIDSVKGYNPDLKVIIGIPPRIHKENVLGKRDPQILENEAIPLLYEIAEEIGADTVDYLTPTKNKPAWFKDYLHPNDEGHAAIAKLALAAIDKAAADLAVEKANKEPEIKEDEEVKEPEIKEDEEVKEPEINEAIISGASDWAKEEVGLAFAAGIMPVSLSENYQANITRQEFCQMVVNMIPADLPAKRTAAFTDCNDEAVAYAYSVGIVNGMSEDSFAPGLSATRQEMATMIFRAYKLIDAAAKPSITSTAPDRENVAAWALEATDFLSEKGIMKGDEKGNINPHNNTSREQAVLLVYRAYCNATGK